MNAAVFQLPPPTPLTDIASWSALVQLYIYNLYIDIFVEYVITN